MKPWLTLCLALCLWPASAASQGLPADLQAALRSARLPPDALAVWVAPVDAAARPRLAWRGEAAHNPASLTKLVTTLAALETLGPAWQWRTPVWLRGRIDPVAGTLEGDLHIAGQGDPTLVIEQLWLLLRRVQQLGVRDVRGDIVLDSSAFAPEAQDPADFDGEPWRPGNVRPDALLLNFKAMTLTVRPDPGRNVAWLSSDLPMPLSQDRVPLKPGPCGDARGSLRANWHQGVNQAATRGFTPLRLDGHLPSACGEQRWPLADPDPASFNARLVLALWREMGGRVSGRVRSGAAPLTSPPDLEWRSVALAQVVRDINKHSNNLMAEQLLLSLAYQRHGAPASTAQGRELLSQWLRDKLGSSGADPFVLDNGSGLSRLTRLSAQQIGQVLLAGWRSPLMPEFVSSLPIAGLDGTLVREPGRFGPALGRAHLKTGSLRDVQAVAGYLLGRSGQRYVVVALLQHPQPQRSVLDAVLRWAAED